MCHTYYKNKNGCPGLSLDVDNRQGVLLFRCFRVILPFVFFPGGNNGAETITFNELGDSFYVMHVYHYTGNKATLVQSEARIALYSNSRAPITMEVPTIDTNRKSLWWLIGHMDGKLGVSSFETPQSNLLAIHPEKIVRVHNQKLQYSSNTVAKGGATGAD